VNVTNSKGKAPGHYSFYLIFHKYFKIVLKNPQIAYVIN